ncbi:citrate/2-methylcitrate synthase [Fusibacillus kribbianus]|uniref:Citrate synthase n=1 Tax=Fusibacillus kribbianus TaxID=3044208 RepID=A0AAP4BA53_9FIRM|nr:citrate/2-methylcitrate synthase [Ruminococcus sp. YH-rum2234]MDI9242300.1 citrate/2-methylcitrate synthase [Ruminococcus sp. YH-rum2234]
MSDDERYNPADADFDARLDQLVEYCRNSNRIDLNLYTEYDVKRGLRDSNGKGVLTGLTEISDVIGFDSVKGKKVAAEGRLYYQGYNVKDLINGFQGRKFAFEEITYLLLFGDLPTRAQMDEFLELMGHYRNLPDTFVRDIIMKAPSRDIMNSLQKSVLTLYTYDKNPDDISVPNVLKQSLHLIAQFPLISVYAYQAYRHYHLDKSLVIRNPKPQLSTAENILRLLRPDGQYTELEAKVLDVALVIHAEHGGGNNSTFTTHVVSSSGTDTYSAVTASLSSLKGFKHGGANLKVQNMFADLKAHVSDWTDEAAIAGYLEKLINREAFDKSGLIYGIGHAVYTKSDPRCVILKQYAEALSKEKDRSDEFLLYTTVERLACQLLAEKKNLHKDVCANVDFYSGFVYNMLGLPNELFTPIFAISRISGWCAHRMEELVNSSKIIRPAYKYVGHHRDYVALDDRK